MAPWIYHFDDAPVHHALPRSQVVLLTHGTSPCSIAGFELAPISTTSQYDPDSVATCDASSMEAAKA